MAGSIKWFLYTDDLGQTYAINLDESNTEAVNGNLNDYLPTSTATAGVPRNIKVRRLYYANVARTRTISCVALTQEIYADVIGGITNTIPDPITTGQDLFLIRADGERRRFPYGQDTGLQDGDAD